MPSKTRERPAGWRTDRPPTALELNVERVLIDERDGRILARDLGLPLRERFLSLRREPGLLETVAQLAWWSLVRGYFAVCQDPENNTFALWEKSENAK